MNQPLEGDVVVVVAAVWGEGEGEGEGFHTFGSHFWKFLSALGRIFSNFLSTQCPISKFLSILGQFFSFVRSRAIKVKCRISSRV